MNTGPFQSGQAVQGGAEVHVGSPERLCCIKWNRKLTDCVYLLIHVSALKTDLGSVTGSSKGELSGFSTNQNLIIQSVLNVVVVTE